MLQLYLGALAFGGTLLLVSLILGSNDADADADGDVEAEAEAEAEAVDHGNGGGHGLHVDGFAWLPVTSLRFWTFLLAFGGATGTLLTYTHALGHAAVAVAAGVVGWASGVSMIATMRTLKKGSVGSEVSTADLRGETAEVVVAMERGEAGKIRVVAKGRILDLIAETDDEAAIASGTKVMILGESAEGRIQVTRA